MHQALQPEPGSGPPNIIPDAIHLQMRQWASAFQITCHPGCGCTLEVLHQRFWLPSMDLDTQELVDTCPVCTWSKTSKQPSYGLLQPFPVPKRTWSHIGVDFIPELPPSQGHTVIFNCGLFVQGCPLCHLTQAPVSQRDYRCHGQPSLQQRCMTTENPTTWSTELPWIEYPHNSLSNASSGLSTFNARWDISFTSPLQEAEISVPSIQSFMKKCERTWRQARTSLLQASRMEHQANQHHTPAPAYSQRQEV